MSAELLISRLHKVRSNGQGRWMACCPAHEDKNPSLSVKQESDGRVLIQCFAGCDTRDVLIAVDLDWEDVMPPEPIYQKAKPIASRLLPSDALRVIQFEARLVCLAAFDLDKGKKLDGKDLDRLKVAITRINTALEAANV
jgi:hypothetical protein